MKTTKDGAPACTHPGCTLPINHQGRHVCFLGQVCDCPVEETP